MEGPLFCALARYLSVAGNEGGAKEGIEWMQAGFRKKKRELKGHGGSFCFLRRSFGQTTLNPKPRTPKTPNSKAAQS